LDPGSERLPSNQRSNLGWGPADVGVPSAFPIPIGPTCEKAAMGKRRRDRKNEKSPAVRNMIKWWFG